MRFDLAEGTYFRVADEFFVGTVDYRPTPAVIRGAAAAARAYDR